jgi:hypothetical protein
LTPGSNSTYLNTNSTQNTADGTHITITKKKNWVVNWEVQVVPRLCELYPGICLTTEEKARKTLSWGSRKVPRYLGGSCPVHLHTQTVHRTIK